MGKKTKPKKPGKPGTWTAADKARESERSCAMRNVGLRLPQITATIGLPSGIFPQT